VPGNCSLCQRRLRSRKPSRHRTYVHHAPAAAVAWSSSKSSSVQLGRARRHRRLPVPGRLCRDPARRTSSYRRSRDAAATGWTCACVNSHSHDRADHRQIGQPAVLASRQCHAREPSSPPGTAGKWEPTITASSIQPQQNPQIPITSHRSPAGSCLGGFRTPARCPDVRPAMVGVRKPSPSRTFRPGREMAGAGWKLPDRFRRLPARSGHSCTRKQMVPGTIGATVETTVESQFSEMVSKGDL
jgi:hypothetical protein